MTDPLTTAANAIADDNKTDVFLYSAGLFQNNVDLFYAQVRAVKRKRENVALILSTNGGSPDAAFQVARCLRRNYKVFTLYVFGDCKSAGTLVAIGANQIVMSDCGQFGPLDVQLADKEELLGQMPALEVSQTLTTLSQTAYNFFIEHFYAMEPGRGISTKMASEIALKLTTAIVEPIASQIDPLLLGRVERSMRIAEAYSARLDPSFRHIKKLVSDYPSHEFVIDVEEASKLFTSVRRPNPKEIQLEECLNAMKLVPHQANNICPLSTALPPLPPATPPETPDNSSHETRPPEPAAAIPAEIRGSNGTKPRRVSQRKSQPVSSSDQAATR
ncbi:MAG: hypothetical protein ACYC67_27000 [Prosthecobacter sp.]